MSIEVTGSPSSLNVAEANRIAHMWLVVNATINGEFTYGQVMPPANQTFLTTAGIPAAWANADGRLSRQIRPTLVTGVEIEVRPATLNHPIQFRRTFANGGAAPLEASGGIPQLATCWAAWLRKFNNVDQTSARQFFGFGNLAASGLGGNSRVVSRVGLIGDGATGFRFGSNNCPDGGAGANGLNDIDANAVQPPILVNPGLSWFHVRVKAIPARADQDGRIACYLNDRLVALFTVDANLPRGAGGASNAYSQVKPIVATYHDAVIQLGGFFMYTPECWFDKDLGL